MYEVVDFKPDHVKMFKNYGGQEDIFAVHTKEEFESLVGKNSYSMFLDGNIIGCAGVFPQTQYRALGWALFQKGDPKSFIHAHKTALWIMRAHNFKRIEAFVDPRNKPAMRWIKMLGFTMERPYIPFYFPDGGGCSAWAYHPE